MVVRWGVTNRKCVPGIFLQNNYALIELLMDYDKFVANANGEDE